MKWCLNEDKAFVHLNSLDHERYHQKLLIIALNSDKCTKLRNTLRNKDTEIMVQTAIQAKLSDETIEEVNRIIRDEIKKAFETVNIPPASAPPKKTERNPVLPDNDLYRDFTNALVEDAIRALKNNNTKEAIRHLTLADQQLTSIAGNQTSKLFIERAIRSIKNNNTKEAITTLKLAYGM